MKDIVDKFDKDGLMTMSIKEQKENGKDLLNLNYYNEMIWTIGLRFIEANLIRNYYI